MKSINKTTVLGNLGADPEVKSFDNGGKIVTLSIATSEHWTDKQTGEQKESTEWHRGVLRGKNADTAEKYLKKGSKVLIEGPMKTRKYTDSQGIVRYTTEIIGLNMIMLDGPQSQQQGSNNSQNNTGFVNNMSNQSQTQQQSNNNHTGYNDVDDNIPQFGANQ